MLANPVMFVAWVGTIIAALLTIFPNLFGLAPRENQRLFNGLVTIILFLTILFANFAEAVAEGRGKAQTDSLRSPDQFIVGIFAAILIELRLQCFSIVCSMTS